MASLDYDNILDNCIMGYLMTDGLYYKNETRNPYLNSDMDKSGEIIGYIIFLPIILIRNLFHKKKK